ncbi:MAG: chemotaxis protein CheD [Clostridiales bacterium]|nr:chemotaxis protein CheD [Clostridiales bacterium]
MGKLVVVGISDQQIVSPTDTLITYALGSCVGICLYDYAQKIAGLSHIMLPEANSGLNKKETYKFANTAIEELVNTMERHSCKRYRLTAKIAGGANMFATSGKSIGERNVEMVKQELQRLRIRILAEDTGANYGRTVEFDPEDGSMVVKSVGKGHKVL